MRALNVIKDMPRGRKIQVITAMTLTLSIMIVTPTYSWFRKQQKMARYEKISSPNTLYITAASREDIKNFQIAGVDVSQDAYWLNADKTSAGRKTYQDYVFAVAGDYVVSYTLQLAHTTNNNYKYEIFEAEVMAEPAAGSVLDKDYVEYKITEEFNPDTLEEITANSIYTAKAADGADKKLYYRVKKAADGTKISLNSGTYVITPAVEADEEHGVEAAEAVSVSYNGHYLNMESAFKANNTKHNDTYGPGNTNSNVETHAEPLYWQATGITGGDPTVGDPFYHEYILRISWDTSGANAAKTDYKDTDIIYIAAKAE